MDPRQKAIEELKKQIKDSRERLGPEAIKELQKLAASMQKPPAKKPAAEKQPNVPPGSVPYDRKSAMKAFEIFLKNHGNPKEFEKRLLEVISKSTH